MGAGVQRSLARGAATVSYALHEGTGAGTAGTGDPLVLLHGWGGSAVDWNEVVAAFRRLPAVADRTVVVIDLPGHGASTTSSTEGTLAEWVEDVAAVLQTEGLGGAVVVGHSLGGSIALELAVRHPALVSRIVGVDTFHYLQVYPRQDEAQIEEFAGGFSVDLPASVDNLIELSSIPDTPASVKEHVRRSTLSAQQPYALSVLVDGLRWDMDAALAELASRTPAPPVSAIVSEPLLSAEALERYGDRIRFVPVSAISHYLPQEDPERTAGLIAAEAG